MSYFLQSISFFDFGKVYAENQLDYTNLVAIFVDDDIYNDIKDDVQRYAQDYIQGSDSNTRYNAISNSRSIVMPIDVENMQATDIVKILENMYFDGVSGEPSKLIGTVLIGDIPLPVINDNGFVYPSIYPYVDFEEQKFIRSDQDQYFVYNDNPKGQAEIWHGVINFENISEYDEYFDKLQNYSDDPDSYIGKNIWYDDFIANKKYFYGEALNSYINNFLFAEDLGYHRYSDLMVKLMQGAHNDMIGDLLAGFDGMDELTSATDNMNTPTMTLQNMIKNGYLKSYTSLIGGKQLDNVLKNVETANRWIETYTGSDGSGKIRTALDTHYLKIEQKDETLLRTEGGTESLIISINNALEEIVDEKVEEEQYWLNEVIPLGYLKYDGYKKGAKCTWKTYDAYENYFFGSDAKYIKSMEETSTYRGTFRNFDNISGLTIDDIQSSDYPSSDIENEIDLYKKSVGGSYDIFATQVDANRGYNINNTINELAIYDDNKIAQREYWNTECDKKFLGICWKRRRWKADTAPEDHLCNLNDENEQGGCESVNEFAIRNRGGASTLNLSGVGSWKSGYNFQDAILPVFDVAGSTQIEDAERGANSFEGVDKYTRLIQKTFVPGQKKYYTKNADKEEPDLYGSLYNTKMGEEMKFTNRLPINDLDDPDWIYTEPLKSGNVSFFDKFDNSTTWEGTGEEKILKITKEYDNDCVGKGEIYTYKTLDSRVKNNLTSEEQINGKYLKVFSDLESPYKVFYDDIITRLNSNTDLLNTNIDGLINNGTGYLMSNVVALDDHIDDITSQIWSIINQFGISSMSSTEIQNMANNWQSALTQNDADIVTDLAEEIKDQLLDVHAFTENFSFEGIKGFVENGIYNFKVQGNGLIFLEDWQNNILSTLETNKIKYNNIESNLDALETKYNNIGEIHPAQLVPLLIGKKQTINAMVVNGSGVGLGCNGSYASLCNAIDIVKNNINTYGGNINNKIDEIESLTYQNYDENGDPDGNETIEPFVDIIENVDNSTINSEFQTLSNIINSIEASNDIGLVKHIPGMNMTTSDRPIDSPRYLTFKGIGGDKVTFIYPNLYKSEVFSGDNNVLKLKSPEEIKYAIEEYLKEVVKKYNEYLTDQLNKKQLLYNSNTFAFNKLGEQDALANPNRSYNTIDTDFLIEKLKEEIQNNAYFGGNIGQDDDPILFLAEMLYYQNIHWQERSLGETIQDDMNNIRTDFDVNLKIKHVLNNYLIDDNDQGKLLTPGYRSGGYEIAFINSDGSDLIAYENEPIFVQNLKNANENYGLPEAINNVEQTQLEEELQNECNIPEEGGVLLFDINEGNSPWINALQCRWEKIREKPFSFEFNWNNSFGPVLNLGNDTTFFGGTGGLANFGNTSLNILGGDNVQSQYMNQLDLLDTEDENQEVLDNSSPGDYQMLNKILSYTQVIPQNENINVDSGVINIKIQSSTQLDDVQFYIWNVGSTTISSNQLGSDNITKNTTGYQTGSILVNPFDGTDIELKVENGIAAKNVLVFNMCLPGTQNIDNCVKKTIAINTIPGAISEIKINGNINVLKGSDVEINIQGKDQFDNNVGNLINESFEIRTSRGTLKYKAAENDKFDFYDFDDANFELNTEGTEDGDQIRLDVNGNIGGVFGTYASKIIQIVEGNLKILDENDTEIDELEIDLPNQNDYVYKDSFDITQTNLNVVPKIIIDLVDLQNETIDANSLISINTKNGIVKPGLIESRYITKTQNGNTFDVEQNRFYQANNVNLSGGVLTIYLMPNMVAGEDVLYISTPGIDDIEIPIIVNPADPSVVKIGVEKNKISTNSSTDATINVTDNWGNLIQEDTMLKIGTIGAIEISGFNSMSKIVSIENGVENFDINAKDFGASSTIYAMINNLSLNEQKPGYANITVQEKILPTEDLNVMYLNLFGSDWANQWGFMSDNNKYAEDLINKSDKLIGVTSQLVDTKNIKRFPIILDKYLNISNMDKLSIEMKLSGNIILEIDSIGDILINIDNNKIQEVDINNENKEDIIKTLISNKYDDENILVYIPEETDSIIETNEVKNNTIEINNQNVFDMNDKTSSEDINIKYLDEKIAGYAAWGLYWKSKLAGKILVAVQDTSVVDLDAISNNAQYKKEDVWIGGSTNNKGIGFYQIDSQMPDDTMGYESIQDSIDPTLGIGFRGNFKNITNFGAGQSVGESTLPFSSEFLINIGDPLLKRIDKNETSKRIDSEGNEEDIGFDQGLGEVVYAEPGKTIFKVKDIDFNNDGLVDMIISFTDGTVKILKNYGGNKGWQKLGDLMILTDGIKEIMVGDVDGNDYDDILIRSKSDELRVYKNEEGIFDVDGLPICLNTNVKDSDISDNPNSVKGLNQIFFEDMDNDGTVDIVTNDKLGFIKIFYGGSNNEGDNFVSNTNYACDEGWYDRQNDGDNVNMVYRFGIRVNENVKVLDQSLVHWQGINTGNALDVSPEDLGIDTSAFDENNFDENNIENILDEATNFDVDAATQTYKGSERYKTANFRQIPIYENIEEESLLPYVEIGCLTGDDPIKIWKKYEDINGDVLENDDLVQISVHIKANENFVGTFVDNIKGPWKIPLTGENDMIANFWFDIGSVSEYQVEEEMKFHWDMDNSRYMVDNIIMDQNDEIVLNYWVYYDGDVQTQKIELDDVNGENYMEFGGNSYDMLDEYPVDDYLDIKIKPSDGCNKSMFILFNENQDRDYQIEYIDLAQVLINYSTDSNDTYDNAMSDINNTLLNNVGSDDIDLSNIPGMSSTLESWDFVDIFSDAWDTNGLNLNQIANIPNEMIDGLMGDVMDKVDGIMSDMCAGFDLSKYGIGGSENCGLLVPFNQAFLGPGNYHLFGCYDIAFLTNTLGKGLPVLTIPGNWPSPAGYLPIPGIFGLPFKGPGDGFLGVTGGPNASQFRLYIVPTLTAEIGIAMCFGPYSVGNAIPDPFSSIGGNCIVTSVPLPCKNAGETDPNTISKIEDPYMDLEACTNQNVPCFVGDNESSSSLEMVSSSSNNNNMTSAVPDGSFAGGFISIEKEPITSHGYNNPESGIEINGVKLFGGAKQQNKIVGSKDQGLIEKIVKKWMDSQINYIFANLTNFKVDTTWPDFDSVLEGMGDGQMKASLEEQKIQDCIDQNGSWEKGECIISDRQKCLNKGKTRNTQEGLCEKKTNKATNDDALEKMGSLIENNWISRDNITDLSETSFANPFEEIEAMFEDVALINLRTENISVKVPIITSDDIDAYTNMSKNWIEDQKEILEDWTNFFKALIGRCGGRNDISSLSEMKEAFEELKEQLKDEIDDNIENNIGNNELENEISIINQKIKGLKKLNEEYNLKEIGNYEIYESCEGGKYYIQVGHKSIEKIVPKDIYLLYNPNVEEGLSMVSKGYDIMQKKIEGKISIKIEKNDDEYKKGNICTKEISTIEQNQCVNLFLGGKLETTLDNFVNIQSNTTQLISSVKQNIDTLELYKQFPLDLYERIHVGDRYLAEISAIVNNFLGTLSLWMKTNATRYSQYVDAIIIMTTTIQTYQAIIDLSTNWSERCSSCTNDNYDQFACKLSMLCPDELVDQILPVLEIPPMKIPSMYLDFSDLNMGIDIKLPEFSFVPTSVNLPSLPNIPEAPSIDMSLDAKQSLSMGINFIENLNIQLDDFNLSVNIPSVPTIPGPPDLPELPSFLPNVEMELPLLPPAPKIPKLPNKISAAIETAETIGKILCIIKGNIGLVGENSIKAKIEQMSQRTYEVPYWDNIDKTLDDWRNKSNSKIPNWISDAFTFLQAQEFEDVELEGFDLKLESHVNLQFNFEGFYGFVNEVVGIANEYSSMPNDWINEQVNDLDNISNDLEKRMSACASNPLSTNCIGEDQTQETLDLVEKVEETKTRMNSMSRNIENGFDGVRQAMDIMYQAENEMDELISLGRMQEAEAIEKELEEMKSKYGPTIDAYEGYLSKFQELTDEYNGLKQEVKDFANNILENLNEQINNANETVGDLTNMDKIEERNTKLQNKIDKFEKQEEIKKNQRNINIDNLYKEIGSNTISYVDYSEDVVKEQKDILSKTLEQIKNKTNDESFKKEINEYISNVKSDTKILALDKNLENIGTKYENIITETKDKNKKIAKTVLDDYDKFVGDVKDNKISLVSNKQENIKLSTKLFDADGISVRKLKQQENVNKLYMEYYKNSINGYTKAIENNSAQDLNMSEYEYNKNKKYLYDIKSKTDLSYNLIEKGSLLAQNNNGNNNNNNNGGGSYTDISSYINGKIIETPEGNIDLANDDYVSYFQNKTIMTDINNDGENDLILRDDNNLYVKYRNENTEYENT
ncbi:MAG TPA: hypothetical protein P5060_01570 [Candidatus Absconditabacterales bacterium]|nr:hypothetical protein [Candidatus Absconditabacterales bacterium]